LLRRNERKIDLMGIVKESWWVILFISFTFSGFVYAASCQKKTAYEISQKIECILDQKNKAKEEEEFLKQKIYSEQDPEFIKMTLIRVLGVVPKGQSKVVFDRLD
jgi:hypothetical protein